MGAAISSTLTMGLTYCLCTATGSLCNACLGSTAEGTTGRKRSVLLLTVAFLLALWFQYTVGPSIVSQNGWVWKAYRWIPGMGKMVYNSWYKSCEQYKDQEEVLQQCAGYAGVYRPMAVATLFFVVSAVATKLQPDLNKQVWPAKFGVFAFAVALTIFLPSAPLFSGIFLLLARIGAAVFVMLQQLILLDVAYNWNESWVERADEQDRLSYGSGSSWLQAIVATCAAFYIASITGIVLLYNHFDECAGNTWIITLTLLAIIAMTAIQLSGSEGSLLTSSIVSLYVVYLAYSMVSKNPDGHCNPVMGSNDVWGMAVGLTLTAVSLAWTGWSWTAEERLCVDGAQAAKTVQHAAAPQVERPEGHVDLDVPFISADSQQATAGLVMDQDSPVTYTDGPGSQVWKLNVVMALISCWVAMTLTGWGAVEQINEEQNAANPMVGRMNMAMIGLSQWLAIGLYIWTLVAPRIYPDRDFS